jgi:hypothetical protein
LGRHHGVRTASAAPPPNLNLRPIASTRDNLPREREIVVDVPDQQTGRNFYFGAASDVFSNCNGCHVLDPANGHFGTDGQMSFEGETQFFKIPHLRNMYQKVGMFGFPHVVTVTGSDFGFKGDQIRGFGFLHDGSFDTLFRFHNGLVFSQDFSFFGPNPGGFPNGPAGDALRRQVEQFMLAFDTELAPIVGQQATLTATSGADVAARIDLFLARAAQHDCDVVVKGLLDGRMRGWVRTDAGTFRSDFAAEPELADAPLRALATAPGRSFTYTCVPPGSGARIGIDHDGDGFPDLTEVDEESDPDDAQSTPGGGAPFTLVTTRTLKLSDGPGPSDRKLTFRASSSRLDAIVLRIVTPSYGSAGDPSFHGARLVAYNTGALADDDVAIDLPAIGWAALGSPEHPTYRFRDRTPGAPISLVTVARDRITVKGGSPPGLRSMSPHGDGSRCGSCSEAVRWCAGAPAKASGNPPDDGGERPAEPLRRTAERHRGQQGVRQTIGIKGGRDETASGAREHVDRGDARRDRRRR